MPRPFLALFLLAGSALAPVSTAAAGEPPRPPPTTSRFISRFQFTRLLAVAG